jgi:hypothetical protein
MIMMDVNYLETKFVQLLDLWVFVKFAQVLFRYMEMESGVLFLFAACSLPCAVQLVNTTKLIETPSS